MRKFQKILQELKTLVATQRPGDDLRAPPSMPFIEFEGRRLYYVSAGTENETSNPPIILLHGFGGFFMDWPRIMTPLSRQTHVYALDLPGWGFSEPNTESTSIEDDVKALDGFLKALNLKNAIVCGISYGGGVTWAAGAMGVRRIRELVLLNPMPPYPLKYIQSWIYRGIFFINSLGRFAQRAHRLMDKNQYKIVCRENLVHHRLLDSFYLELGYLVMKQPKIPRILGVHARAAKTVDWASWEHRMAGIRLPVSILQGNRDKVFSMESAQYIQKLIPHSQLIEVEDCGHAIVFDQHRRVSDFLLSRLTKEVKHGNFEEVLQQTSEG